MKKVQGLYYRLNFLLNGGDSIFSLDNVEGCICERVNTTDKEEKSLCYTNGVGQIFHCDISYAFLSFL